MLNRHVFQTLITAAVLLTCNVAIGQVSPLQSKLWVPNERAGLGSGGDFSGFTQKLISVPLSLNNPQLGNFDLHYFVKAPENGPGLKTVLFCAGGPGQLARPGTGKTFADFFQESGYNVVYFDLRGSGFSQIPPLNTYDKFLNTANAVEDIESIRRDFLGDRKWDAIIGYSYGAVLAQQYTHKYADKVGKLVLLGPVAFHQFASSATAYEDYFRNGQRIRRQVMEKIYSERDEFKTITPQDRNKIMDDLFGTPNKTGVFKVVEDVFGSERFVINAYCGLRNSDVLTRYGLPNYSRHFFEMLRRLREIGWQRDRAMVDDEQVSMVKVLTLNLRPDLKTELGELEPEPECSSSYSQESDRGYYVIAAYDGLNRRFLREWFINGKKGVRNALLKSAGLAHIEMAVNKSMEKVGIDDDEPIKPWDPANYPHDRPTLVLKGGADPVTAGGQAERYYTHGLNGQRTLIEFEGVGHHFYLPRGLAENNFSDGTVVLDPPNIPAGKTAWVTGTFANVRTTVLEKSEGDLFFNKVQLETNNKVLVEVYNTSQNAVSMPAKQFPLNADPKFTGFVNIDAKNIPGKAVTWASGTISVNGAGLKFTLDPPSDFESGLEYTGNIDTDSWNKVHVEVRNKNAFSVDAEPLSWIYKPLVNTFPNRACITGTNVISFNSLDCILYAFVETQYSDFIRFLPGILDRIRNFVTHPPKSCWEKGCDPLDN
jgi:pimeloyl-ACP methyl ester carboxylesterase